MLQGAWINNNANEVQFIVNLNRHGLSMISRVIPYIKLKSKQSLDNKSGPRRPTSWNVEPVLDNVAPIFLHRKATCVCGGKCPKCNKRCAQPAGVQSKTGIKRYTNKKNGSAPAGIVGGAYQGGSGSLGDATLCDEESVNDAINQSRIWISKSYGALRDYRDFLSGTTDKSYNSDLGKYNYVANALLHHFHPTVHALAESGAMVRSEKISLVKDVLDTIWPMLSLVHRMVKPINSTASNPRYSQQCSGHVDAVCVDSLAYAQGDVVYVCPSFFEEDPDKRTIILIHEIAHASGKQIDDRAYEFERYYQFLTPFEAKRNAESYAGLVYEVGTDKLLSVDIPQDNFTNTDCDADWVRNMKHPLALAEIWNRKINDKLRNVNEKKWKDLWSRFLGPSAVVENLAGAKMLYNTIEKLLQDPLDSSEGFYIDCQVEQCNSPSVMAISDTGVLLCGDWKTLPSDADKAQKLLEGLYEGPGKINDSDKRENHARLARNFIQLKPMKLISSGSITGSVGTRK